MGTFTITTTINTIARFIMLQLFINCISLCFLGYWGITQPILSPLGNMLFAPFLTLFLLISTIIFFAYIVNLPIKFLIYILEKITALWTLILDTRITIPSASCVQPPLWVLIGLPLIALFIITDQRIKKPYGAIFSLFLLLLSTHLILYFFYTKHTLIYSLPYNNGTITIIRHQGKTILIDPGVIGRKISASSWCEYTLAPEIIKKTGIETVDHCICLRPGKVLFDALAKMAQKITIRNLYIPWWEYKVPLQCFKSYQALKKIVIHNKGTIHRIAKTNISIKDFHLTIKNSGIMHTYYDARFPQCYIEGIIDNKHISIYAP